MDNALVLDADEIKHLKSKLLQLQMDVLAAANKTAVVINSLLFDLRMYPNQEDRMIIGDTSDGDAEHLTATLHDTIGLTRGITNESLTAD